MLMDFTSSVQVEVVMISGGEDTFLKKPLSTVDKTDFVQKQVWGGGQAKPKKEAPAPVGMIAAAKKPKATRMSWH